MSSSIIIEHMVTTLAKFRSGRDRGRIGYLYLNYKKEDQQLIHLLGSIIKQIIQSDPIHRSLQDLWLRCHRGRITPSPEELRDVIRDLGSDGPTYIIIDALDECALNIRTELVKVFQTNDDRFSVLITSRYLEEFHHMSRAFSQQRIEAHREDLELFIDYKFQNMSFEWDRALRDEIKHTVVSKCDGM